jgi:HEAT repeat protein
MSSLWTPLSQPWTFDAVSALIGAGVGLALGAAAAYSFREEIERAIQNTRGQVTHTRERLTMGAQHRYLEWLTNRVAALHVLRDGVSLSDLYLVPEFVTPPPHPSVSAKPTEPPPPTVPLAAVLKATSRLIVTGVPGSGRSALLAHLVRLFAEDPQSPGAQAVLGLEEHRLPIYLHLGELSLEPEQPAQSADALADAPASPTPAPAKPSDPAQPLIDAISARLPLLAQAGAPGMLRNSIKRGEAILLLDGLDELEADARSSAMRWITSFCEANAGVRVVMAAAPVGLAPLLDAGFTAIPLAPWTPVHVMRLAERWARAAKGGEQDAARLAETLKPVPGTAPLPIDVTLAAFMWQKHGSVPPNRATAYGQTVDIFLESVQATSPMSPLLARAAMGRLALSLFKENRFTATRAEIEKLVTELLPPPPPDPRKAAEVKPDTPPPEAPAEGEAAVPAPAELPPPEPPKPKGVPESVEALIKCGLLVERGKDRFAFEHRRIQGYLAAWQITQSGEGALLMQHLEDPEWSDVLEFCAGLVNVAPLVDMLLKRDDDLFHSRLWTVATWAASAGPDVAWRGKVLAQLAQFFSQPNQLGPLRERAMLALLSTQDKGLGYVFKQAMASSEPLVRALAVRGLGMLGREPDLATFEAALKDPDASVSEAAVRAMGSVGGTAGIEHLASVLLEADESQRKVAALTLAECGDEGQRLLKDAVREDDMLVRRATTFGLAATRTDWARELLVKMEKDDPQWFVRSAASEALASMQSVQEYALDCSPIALDKQGWLVEWGATRGMTVGLGRSAEPVLMRALAEGDTPVKLAAIHTLANIGGEPAIEPLRAQLASSDPDVHAAAYQALKNISDKTGIKIARA